LYATDMVMLHQGSRKARKRGKERERESAR
jgi:hypothetical protein